MRQSGLADLFASLRRETVYVGVSAGSMVATSQSATPRGELDLTFALAPGIGLVDFSLFPHLDYEAKPDTSLANVERWAARLPVPMYAIDDQTAIKVANGTVEVVSEGSWKLFNKPAH